MIEVLASSELNKDSYIYQSEEFFLSEGDCVLEIDYVADLEGAECELYAPSLMEKIQSVRVSKASIRNFINGRFP